MKAAISLNEFIANLQGQNNQLKFLSLKKLEQHLGCSFSRLPYTIRILIENTLRNQSGGICNEEHLLNLTTWSPQGERNEMPFYPARIVLQDLTGLPVLVDLASFRESLKDSGGNPSKINPKVPSTLIVDHSVQVDFWQDPSAREKNEKLEFLRNNERYRFLKWASKSFENLQIIPPGAGIIHQINTEFLSQVIFTNTNNGFVYPDTCIGTDSHTPMINGLGVLGWGVGGIEAEAAMLGEPIYFLCPDVIGIYLKGSLRPGVVATDLALFLTELLRKKNVVGKFVEFYGPGVFNLSVFDRTTVSNMAPEQGSTVSIFPVDRVLLDYLKLTGRQASAQIVETYFKEQELFYYGEEPEREYSAVIDLDLAEICPAIAGPKKPQQRLNLPQVKTNFKDELLRAKKESIKDVANLKLAVDDGKEHISHGSIVLAAITSCTNTANPAALITAGLLAKKALTYGLKLKSYTKASFSPGSKVTTAYLNRANLLEPLGDLGFRNVGYGCMTCIGNSGELAEEVSEKIIENDLVVAAVISGNRNFEGRIHPLVQANYLASPALVVACALAGSIKIDLSSDPIGKTKDGKEIYLKDLWPTTAEVEALSALAIDGDLFKNEYSNVYQGSKEWQDIIVQDSELFPWDRKSSYIARAPFIEMCQTELDNKSIRGARTLAVFGDFITTDHISPAGNIPLNSPAGRYLIELGIKQCDFNSYGSRRGNHEVMKRGTFANIRLKNLLVSGGREGIFTKHFPSDEELTIFDATERYKNEKTPLIIIAGKEYGSGSSRDWAAKGPALLGVKAILAESFERIHRSNLIGMGILPLQFRPHESYESLGLTGEEIFNINIPGNIMPSVLIEVEATRKSNNLIKFQTICRIDFPIEQKYFRVGGLLPTLFKQML